MSGTDFRPWFRELETHPLRIPLAPAYQSLGEGTASLTYTGYGADTTSLADELSVETRVAVD